MRKRALALGAALVAISAPLKAQSLFNSAGLGLPMEALDGRARALGCLWKVDEFALKVRYLYVPIVLLL